MAKLTENSLAASLAGYTIDSIGEFTKVVRDITGIRIGGVYAYGNKYRHANMMRNPAMTRYGILGSSAGGDFIGQKHYVETIPDPNPLFLDSVGGLEGFTHEGGYLNYAQNTYVQQNMGQSIEKNLMDLHEKQQRYDGQEGERYTVYDIPGNTGVDKGILVEDLNRLKDKTVSYLVEPPTDFNIGLRTTGNTIGNKKYLGDTFDGFGESKTRTDTFYKVNTHKENSNSATTNNILNAESVNRPSYNVNLQNIAQPNFPFVDPNEEGIKKYTMYELYNEDGKLAIDDKANTDTKTGIMPMMFDESLDSVEKSTLLYKTNELFKTHKIGSLINRFHTTNDDGKKVGLTQSSVDVDYGLSRGRNLRKLNKTDHDGYDNPWCRVWTSHYQYSKFNDLIRHKGFSENDPMYNFQVLRPNNAMKRLNDFSSLQDNGLPRIAPMKSSDDIKKCMFSIENLAWKDILTDAWVDGTTNRHGRVLSKEQQGPNGGRIMWFPPYNLKVNENVSVNWNSNNFIGRGEPIYTYTNTERTGTLSFTILVDHPSIVDNWVNGNGMEANAANEQKLLRFFAGCDDGSIKEDYINVKKEVPQNFAVNNKDVPKTTPKPENENWDVKLRYFVFFPNNFSGKDYYAKGDVDTPKNYLWSGAYSGGTGYEVNSNPNLGIGGCVSTDKIKGGLMNGGGQAWWYYEVDDDKKDEALLRENYKDTTSYGLNKSAGFTTLIQESKVQNTLHVSSDEVKNTFTYQDLLSTDFNLLKTYFDGVGDKDTVQDSEFQIKCYVRGYASSHGYVEKNLGEDGLAKRRAKFLKKYLETLNFTDSDNILITDNGVIDVPKENRDVSSLEAKLGRCAEVIIGLVRKNNTPGVQQTEEGTVVSEENMKQNKVEITKPQNIQSASTTIEQEVAHYDDEYQYFTRINDNNDLVRRNLVEKCQYFDPAFHSITPEGFNARLTFLHQCTRQGPTTSASDLDGHSAMGAGNLAFGRPPVCILRIGDFYFTKIIIDSLSIDYDSSGGIQWDLNPEGVGIQPMLANVTLGIKFLGGSDLSGPIARLQDAVSFNFFANASAYDRRADYRHNFISASDDEAEAWNPMRVNKNITKDDIKNNGENSETYHKPFSTIKN